MRTLAELLRLRPQDMRRLLIGMLVIAGILLTGTIGYSVTAELGILDAFYMTLITISTVGYGELGTVGRDTRILTVGLIIASLVWGAWALQAILGTVLSAGFRQGVSQLRSIRRAKNMESHTIICGYGRIGRAIAAELERNKEPYVVIDASVTLVDSLRDQGQHVIHGNATEDEALMSAGVSKAKRLLAVLNTDNANIVTVLSARQLNPQLWIASRVVQSESASKLYLAGANEVLSPYDFGGRRMALTALRPHVAQFLSEVVFDEGRGAEMDEIEVFAGSELAEQTLEAVELRGRFGVTAIALHHPRAGAHGPMGFELNPGPQTVIHSGDVLIVVGTKEQLYQMHVALRA